MTTSGLLVIASLAIGQVDGIPSNYEHVQELEYFVGHWKAQGAGPQGTAFTVLRSYQWVLNKNFLADEMVVKVGDRQVWASAGMMGWDPSEKKIKRWTADGTGGIGIISWTRNENGGTGEYAGLTADGENVSATYTIEGTDEDHFTYRINDLQVGDNAIPQIEFEFARTEAPKPAPILQTEEASSNNYDRLKQDDCFVGEWTGKGTVPWGQEFVAQVVTKWTLNKNFLDSALTAKIGDRVVYENKSLRGWDPSTQQVTQWSFNSWGGVEEAVVTKEGDKKRVLQSQGVTADGGKVTSKTVFTIGDANAFSVVTTDQEIDGEAMGDIRVEYRRKK